MVVAHATNDDNYLEIPDMHSHWLIVLPGETIRDLDFLSAIQKTQKSSKTMDQMKLEIDVFKENRLSTKMMTFYLLHAGS